MCLGRESDVGSKCLAESKATGRTKLDDRKSARLPPGLYTLLPVITLIVIVVVSAPCR